MKSLFLALVLWLLASPCTAQSLDPSEQARALKLQEEFKSGKIDFCSYVEVDGRTWLVLDVTENTVLLFGQHEKLLDINNLADLAAIKRVVQKDCPN